MKTLSIVSNALFIFEILLLILGQLGRITLPNGISFYVLEIIVLMHVVAVTIYRLILFERNKVESRTIKEDFSIKFIPSMLRYSKSKLLISIIRKSRTVQLATLWIILCTVVLVIQSPQFSPNGNIRASSYLFRVANFALFAFIVAPNISKKMVKNTVDALSLALPLLALAQYVFLPDLRFLAEFGWDPHMYRSVGTIFDPPIMGSILGMLIIWQLINNKEFMSHLSLRGTLVTTQSHQNQLSDCRSRLRSFAMTAGEELSILLIYFSIIFLYSRSTYIALFISINYIFWINRKYFLLLFFSIFFIFSIYLAPQTIPAYRQLESAKLERLSTVTSRKTEILAGLDAFAKNPVWGIGYNRVREYKTISNMQFLISKSKDNSSILDLRPSDLSVQNHAGSAYHSFWVTQLATTGVVGFGLLLWFFAEVIRKKPQFAAIFFVPAFIGLFDNTLFHPFVMIILVILYFGCQSKAQPTI